MLLSDPVRLRRIMLRLMLAALGACGGLAVLAVLLPHNIDSWRMIGTTAAAAIASAVLFWSCRLLDSDRNRATGLLLMSFVIAQFIMTILAIWDPLGGPNSDENAAITAVLFPVVWIPATVFFHVGRKTGGTFWGWAGIAGCAATYVFFLTAIWSSGVWWNSGDQIWGMGWSCYFFAFLSAGSLAGIGINRNHWRWIGVIASVVAFFIAMRASWTSATSLGNPFVISATIGLLVAHANLLLLLKLKPGQLWLRWATIVCAWIAGAIFDYAVWTDVSQFFDEPVMRFGMAAAICAGCGTVALSLLAAFNRKALPVKEVLEFKEVTVICPACGRKGTFAVTDSRTRAVCPGCGLGIGIELSLPRCAKCDYSLLMLKSDRCPECGTPIVGNASALNAPAH
jgi:hypothetical protein